MSFNENNFRISNEHLLLINILNTMYNDNIQQINFATNTLNNLYQNNNHIRDLLVQLLGTRQNNTSFNNTSFNNTGYFNTTNNSRRNRSLRRESETNRISNFNRFLIQTVPLSFDDASGNIYTDLIGTTGTYNSNRVRNSQSNNLFSQLLRNFLQPIEVYPTQSQIESATRVVRYCDITRPINTQCPISMDDFNDDDMVTVIRTCGHIFNSNSLQNWFSSNCRCPVCRFDIRDFNLNASSEFFNNTQQSNSSNNSNNNSSNNTNSSSNYSSNNTNTNTNNSTTSILNNRNNFEMTDLMLHFPILDSSGNIINITNDLLATYILNNFTSSNI